MKGWRPLLRLAWRDVLRSRARSILVLVVIALPVLAVTAADVVAATSEVAPHEAIERRIGAADAMVYLRAEGGPVEQLSAVYPDAEADGDSGAAPATFDDVADVLGAGTRGVEVREGSTRVRTDKGTTDTTLTETALADPLLEGTFSLKEGRLPKAADEVAVSPFLASRGPGLGEELQPTDGKALTVVGIVDPPEYRDATQAWALPGAFALDTGDQDRQFLVDAPGDVSWADVMELNSVGVIALSRVVADDPPPQLQNRYGYGMSESDLAIFILIVMMALLEVVLLAGPAFAVRARSLQRQLAIVSANGGTPGQVRRAVLATGVVVGGLGAGIGVALGIPLGWALLPAAQAFSSSWFGPFDVPWMHLLGIAGFGFLSAVLAAIVPAWIASRQDVVRVLAGRRGDRRPGAASPVLGLVLIAVGLYLTWRGTKPGLFHGETWIGFGAVFVVLGSVLLVPIVVALLGKSARRAPLAIRYAVRDAARHRTRTAPAIGAALASVAGVVALGIAATSDEQQRQHTYQPQLAMGTGMVSVWSDGAPADEAAAQWERVATATKKSFPEAVEISGLNHVALDGSTASISLHSPDDAVLLDRMGSVLPAVHLVGERLPALDLGIGEAERAAADRALGAGSAVVFTDRPVDAAEAEFIVETYDESDDGLHRREVSVPALYVEVESEARAEAVLPPVVAAELGMAAAPVGLALDFPVSRAAERDLAETLTAISESTYFYVERGYERPDEYVVTLLVLVILGTVLMLGGTLTATFLALSDARPDLATLSAVGAAPRTRRLVAAAYAFVIGGIGALLGAIVGFVPGIAATWPLTSDVWGEPGTGSTHTIDIPWLLILGVVVGLPILTAAVVGLFARSRLPMVARID